MSCRVFAAALVVAAVGCGAPERPDPREQRLAAAQTTGGTLALRNARLPGGAAVEVLIRDGVIAEVGSRVGAADRERDLGGHTLAPQIIDSHVHLAYWPVADALSDGGVAAVVDLAAPIDRLGARSGALAVARSGPMITAPDGYPTQSWGRDGYGLEVADPPAARAAVRALVGRGAAVIKVAVGSGGLDRPRLDAVVAETRAAGVPVAAHGLKAADVDAAADAGVDALAHAPIEPLSAAQAARWKDRHVITTLSAFAPNAAARNLARLIEAGAIPVYGTDLGNTRELAVSRSEIAAMTAAGMSPAAILESMTAAPARLWGFDDLGAIEPGRRAALLVLDRDPLEDPLALAAPVELIR